MATRYSCLRENTYTVLQKSYFWFLKRSETNASHDITGVLTDHSYNQERGRGLFLLFVGTTAQLNMAYMTDQHAEECLVDVRDVLYL